MMLTHSHYEIYEVYSSILLKYFININVIDTGVYDDSFIYTYDIFIITCFY